MLKECSIFRKFLTLISESDIHDEHCDHSIALAFLKTSIKNELVEIVVNFTNKYADIVINFK